MKLPKPPRPRPWTPALSYSARRYILPRDLYMCQDKSPECESPYLPLPPERLEVDHIHPIKDGGALLDPANLRAICKTCHRRKTAIESGRSARRRLMYKDDRRKLSNLENLAVRRQR